MADVTYRGARVPGSREWVRGRSDATETAEALLRKRIDNLRASLLRLRTHDARMLLEIRLAECEKELAAKAGAEGDEPSGMSKETADALLREIAGAKRPA